MRNARNLSGGSCISGRYRLLPLLAVLATATCAAIDLTANAQSSSSDRAWDQLEKNGVDALDTNRYWLAEPLLKQAQVKAEAFGPSDLRLAKSLGELGRLYTIRGRFTDAEPYLERELFVRELAAGGDIGPTIPAMGSLIRFYLQYGTASKADPMTEEILTFVEGKLREPVQRNRGKVILKKGETLEAWAGQADVGMRDPLVDWAIAIDAMANVYRLQEKYETADRLYKAALDLKETVYGKGHLSLANSYDSLGVLCMEKGQLPEAESYFRDALLTTERTLAPESPEVYSRLEKLAKCQIKQGKFEQAEKLYLRAQNFWKGAPSKTGDEARAAFALGCLYCDQKNYEAAAPALEKALVIAEKIHGPSSERLVPYLQKYAYALYYLGRKPETDQLRARADSIAGIGSIQ